MAEPRIFLGDMYLMVNEDIHQVFLYKEGIKLEKNFGYIKDGFVYIYRGKLKKEPRPCSIYTVEENGVTTIKFYGPETDLDKEMYSVDKIVDFDPTKIFDTIEREKENFLNKEIVEVMNNNREIFTVTIKDTDDFLKYVVKKAINDKKINLKNYRHKFDSPYDLNNLKSGLQKDTKMTVTNFKTWCEVLGLKWYMKVEDDGTDKLSPLLEPIEITSDDF